MSLPIANVATNNTFDEWRTKTNELILYINEKTLNNEAPLTGNATVNGNFTVNLGLTVSGNSTFGPVAIVGVSTITGANLIITSQNTAIGSNTIFTGQTMRITGSPTINGATVIANTLVVSSTANTGNLNVNGSILFSGEITSGGPRYFGALAVITVAELSAQADNYNPSGLANAQFVRLRAASNVSITGLVAANTSRAREITMFNFSNSVITLVHESVSSTDVYRFVGPLSTNVAIVPGTGCKMFYDPNSPARWRITELIGFPPGAVNVSGNLAVTGTLTVSGNTTLGGTLSANGVVNLNTPTAARLVLPVGTDRWAT